MLMKLLNVALFWRRNNLPSIVFKSATWFALAWLFVGIFTSFQTAVIAGVAAGGLAAVKYTLQNLKRRKRLLAKVGGDKAKLKQLQAATNQKGLGGALMGELLNAELDDDDDDYEEPEPLTTEQKEQAMAALTLRCKQLTTALVAGEHATAKHCTEATSTIIEAYAEERDAPEVVDLLREFLPHAVIDFCTEDCCNDDDHAEIVTQFSESTNGKWDAGETSSTYDEESGKWLVHFFDKGQRKTWRFKQHADHLNSKFIDQLIQYTQSQSGHVIHVVEAIDDSVELTCLPSDIHNLMFSDEENLAA